MAQGEEEAPEEGEEELRPCPPTLPGDLLCRSRRRRRAARYSEAGSTPSSSRRWAAQRVQEGCRRAGGEEQTGRRKRQKVKEGDPNPGEQPQPRFPLRGTCPQPLALGKRRRRRRWQREQREAVSEAGMQEGRQGGPRFSSPPSPPRAPSVPLPWSPPAQPVVERGGAPCSECPGLTLPSTAPTACCRVQAECGADRTVQFRSVAEHCGCRDIAPAGVSSQRSLIALPQDWNPKQPVLGCRPAFCWASQWQGAQSEEWGTEGPQTRLPARSRQIREWGCLTPRGQPDAHGLSTSCKEPNSLPCGGQPCTPSLAIPGSMELQTLLPPSNARVTGRLCGSGQATLPLWDWY